MTATRFLLNPISAALLIVATSCVHAEEQLDESSALQLNELKVVSAAGFEQNIADAPASISVISREQLEKQSYTDVIDAVKNIPGVYVTGGGNNQDISIRGMSSSYTLYLVDGRPISSGRSVNTNGSDGGKQIGLPPLSMIERIEVIRGPMSSLYGSEAMGGVINIITRRGGDEWNGTVSSEYTHSMNDLNEDAHLINFYTGGALVPGLLGAKFHGSYAITDESEWIGGEDGAASTPDSRRRKGGAEIWLTPNEQNRFALSYDASRLDETHNDGKSFAFTNGNTKSTVEYEKDVFALTHEGNYGDLVVNSYIQHDISERVQDDTKKEEATTVDSKASYFFGDHVITFGGQYKYEELVNETNGVLDLTGVDTMDRWMAAAYSEIDWGVTEDFRLTTGLRYNEDEMFGGHLSPRIYGVYHFTPNLTFKGGVSTGYKQPSLPDVTEGFGSKTGKGSSVIFGNEDLKPETTTSYELGLVYDNRELGLNTSAMLFHTKYEDKIMEYRECSSPNGNNSKPATWKCYDPNGNLWNFWGYKVNVDEAEIQGVELTLDYDLLPSVHLSSSYTYTESEQLTGDNKGEPLNKQPKHMVNALLDWTVTPKLNAWLQGNYRSETSDYLSRTSMKPATPGYGFFDVGVVYALDKNIDLKAGLYNIANKEVSNGDYEVVLDGRRVTVGVSMDF
jgi:outer membrane receptor for ferrienterochelin and colicins